MKKMLFVLALISASTLTANPYSVTVTESSSTGKPQYQGQGYNQGQRYYQGQPQYQDQPQYQGQGYNQGQPQYQSQGYYQEQPQYQGNQSWSQNQPYQDNQSYQAQPRNTRNISDQEIAKNVRDVLSSSWFSQGYEDVTFEVNNGVVVLSGDVKSLADKKKVEDAIRKIDGVRQLGSQLTVNQGGDNSLSTDQVRNSERKYPQDYAATDVDRQINAKIREKLNGGWFSKGNETLILKTTNGVVVITGLVEKSDDAQKINDEIKKVSGVRSINNQLDVKNNT